MKKLAILFAFSFVMTSMYSEEPIEPAVTAEVESVEETVATEAVQEEVAESAESEDNVFVGKWNPYKDKNKKAVGYIELNADGTGYFKYAPDGKHPVADGSLKWEIIEKKGKTYLKFSENKLKDVNKEWECSISADGVLIFKNPLCFGVYPKSTWKK